MTFHCASVKTASRVTPNTLTDHRPHIKETGPSRAHQTPEPLRLFGVNHGSGFGESGLVEDFLSGSPGDRVDELADRSGFFDPLRTAIGWVFTAPAAAGNGTAVTLSPGTFGVGDVEPGVGLAGGHFVEDIGDRGFLAHRRELQPGGLLDLLGGSRADVLRSDAHQHRISAGGPASGLRVP